MIIEDIKKYIVHENSTLKETIKILNSGGIGFVVIVNHDDIVNGIFTDGDFRRIILDGISLDTNIKNIANKNFQYFKEGHYNENDADEVFRKTIFLHIPILKENKLIKIITRSSFTFKSKLNKKSKLNIPAIIMAGGKGTRLDPFTRVLPKPLIPIGDKTILEIIMDEYVEHGITDFYLSVNYKKKIIQAYFDEYKDKYRNIHYLNENTPLGTIGSIKLVEDKITRPFFVSNCDIMSRITTRKFISSIKMQISI